MIRGIWAALWLMGGVLHGAMAADTVAPSDMAADAVTSLDGTALAEIATPVDITVQPDLTAPDISDFQTADEIQIENMAATPCASDIFADALRATASTVSDASPKHVIQEWIRKTMQNPDVLGRVIQCPEIQGTDELTPIAFSPIEYTFPSGRHISINYESQPKILRQRVMAAARRSLPTSDPNPEIGNDGAIWVNTDPAWYGILVVQHDSLKNFVGPDRANTVSLAYINDNIDAIYPAGNQCTSRSALASDSDMINIAMHETVGATDDSNDYYVAGDVNLQWITWGEVALDVAITVATAGGGAVVLGGLKGARATRAAKNLIPTIRNLEKIDTVRDYLNAARRHADAVAALQKIDRTADATRYADAARDVTWWGDRVRDLERNTDVTKYKQATSSFADVMKYRRNLGALKNVRRGNIITRAWRAARSLNTGTKTIDRAARLGRAGMKSGRVRDWLFQSTMKNAAKLAKVEAAGGLVYGAMHFVGDMYDWTESSTGDFTNNIEFKPLCLLSADDLEGQENVVNHGMWLMWTGHSTDAADDDAAYLKAMDTAAKFHQDLTDAQDARNIHACDVDIFVVRPIIRNPADDNAQLYYLIMNDVPWTTAEN